MRWWWLTMVALGFPAVLRADVVEVTGANVEERPEVVLHVNQGHERASDRNDGGEDTPLRTIQAAAARAFANRGQGRATKVLIHPGTYRESVRIGSFELDPEAPAIIFEGTEPGAVVIRGSDVWTGWRMTRLRVEDCQASHNNWRGA